MKDGKPALGGDAEFGRQRGTECLACEYECWFRGKGAITIEAPIPGLEEYRGNTEHLEMEDPKGR